MVHWTFEKKVRRFWDLCQDCAQTIYGNRPPNEKYAASVARMLFGTAAQEGNLDKDRQESVPWDTPSIGAVSVCQLEKGSIKDSIDFLLTHPEIADRVTAWLFDDPRANTRWLYVLSVEDIMWAMMLDDNHKLGLAFARLHYFWRTPEPIPSSIEDQAQYWLKYYNGGGVLKYMSKEAALSQYVQNFERHFQLI